MKKIRKIRRVENSTLVDIETGTHTFIAEGLVSHNSAYQPSLDQCGREAITYLPSSPWTKVGQFYELYKAGSVLMREYLAKQSGRSVEEFEEDLELLDEVAQKRREDMMSDPEFLILQFPSWEMYRDWQYAPKLIGVSFNRAIQYPPANNGIPENERMARLERRDPAKFRVERRAQFADVQNAYLDPLKVDQMFEPFTLDEDKDLRFLTRQEAGSLAVAYHGHADPSKSNANFAIAIGHLEQSKIPDVHGKYWGHVVFDYLHVYQPKDFEGHTVDYLQIYDDLEALLKKFRSMREFTFDQWNSVHLISQLQRSMKNSGIPTSIHEVNFTQKRNSEVAEKFKGALNLGWIHAYRDDLFNEGEGSLLENELKFLVDKNGKIDKQSTGPVTTMDLAECVMEVSVRLLSTQLDEWDRAYGEVVPELGLQGGYPQVSPRGVTPSAGTSGGIRDQLNSLSSPSTRLRSRTRGRY